jgi:hypothetical protein
MAPDLSGIWASARALSSSDKRIVALVLTTIKEIKDGTYKVEKGGKGGKYLVERRLPRAAYQLLLKNLEQEDENSAEKDEETLQGYFGWVVA